MKTHETKITVRYSETDQMGRAYYSRYLEWFELARSEHLKAAGYPYSEMEKQGTFLVVADTYIKYLKPARYEEPILIRTNIADMSRASVTFEYEVINERTKDLLATGNSKLASITKDGKITYIPDIIRIKLRN